MEQQGEVKMITASLAASDNLQTKTLHDTITVVDPDGGIWWPSDEARTDIERSTNPAETALRICREQPMRGVWRS